MSDNRTSSTAVLALSLSCHALAFWYYRLNAHLFPVPPRWHVQIAALIAVSACLSVVFFLIRSLPWIPILLCLKFSALMLVGYPLGEHMGVETILIIPLLMETVMAFSFPFCIAAGTVQILLTVLLQKPHNVWSVDIHQADMGDILFFAANSSIILFLSSLIRILAVSLSEKEHEVRRLDAAVEKITTINLDYQKYATNVERESMEKERNRITREIHDIIGYSLTNQLMIIQAALVYKESERPRLNELLLRAQSQLNESIEEARGALRQLRNTEPARDRGLVLFRRIAKTFEEITGVVVEIDFANVPDSFEPGVEKTICRLLQEGMTNAFRHGRAEAIWIAFWFDEVRLNIQIRDNGRGQVKMVEGIGLRGMKERFSALGGGVDAHPVQDGFSLQAWIPVRPLPMEAGR